VNGYLSHWEAEQVYTLVEECCELGQEPAAWQAHLATNLEGVIGGYAGSFLAIDRPARRVFGSSIGEGLGTVGTNLFAEFVQGGGQPQAPGLRGAWAERPGTVFCASLVELSSVAALHDSAFHRDYLAPIHVHDLLTANAAPCAALHINLSVSRGRHERVFGMRERSKLTALVDAVGSRFERKLWSQRQGMPPAAAEKVLMVTDMVDFTGLVRRAGDLRARTVVRRHNETMRASFAQHCAREVAHTGDGFIAAFGCEREAVACARAIQRAFADLAAPLRGESIRVRIGIHAGPVLDEEARLFGAALIAAVRICSHAGAGQILISEQVLGRLDDECRAGARSLGATLLKGFADHAILYEIAPPLSRATDRVIPADGPDGAE
jgi:class 3 adenylate cyclase